MVTLCIHAHTPVSTIHKDHALFLFMVGRSVNVTSRVRGITSLDGGQGFHQELKSESGDQGRRVRLDLDLR